MSIITMTRVQPGFPKHAVEGSIVTYVAPAGCVLRRSSDTQAWVDVPTPSPFTHTGAPAHYRVDCDQYEGTPKQIQFDIE